MANQVCGVARAQECVLGGFLIFLFDQKALVQTKASDHIFMKPQVAYLCFKCYEDCDSPYVYTSPLACEIMTKS